MADISIKLCAMTLPNPTILASGIVGISRASLTLAAQSGAALVTTKSLSIESRKGHAAPIILTYPGGMINSVGYSNPGIDNVGDEFSDLKSVGSPVIGSITGRDEEEFKILAEKAAGLDFSAIEVVLSCPHTPGYGTMAGLSTPKRTEAVTRLVKDQSKVPVFVKLSPNVMGLVDLAKAAEAAGADAITAVNTAGPGMLIDIVSRKPILGGKIGGLSGHALRPIAVRCVYEIAEAVRIPIIGTGGVYTGQDAIEMILAGATAVGIGSSVYDRGITVFQKVSQEMQAFMDKESIRSLNEIRGAAHEA
ncbi:dihydroorotate dehydrogenase B catalytic subunit [bacterium F11]|nr:dihydroorotate dehydrogenase B catalytic subunit [bacterium F11]